MEPTDAELLARAVSLALDNPGNIAYAPTPGADEPFTRFLANAGPG